MGLENREYLQGSGSYDDGYGSPRPSGPKSVITKIIIVTVAVFVVDLFLGNGKGDSPILRWLSLSADTGFFGQIWRFVTYGFVHDQQNLFHIAFNMMMLFSVGQIVLPLLGDREFLWFYLVSLGFAGLSSAAVYGLMGMPGVLVIGASGGVMSVFCLAAMHYPRRTLLMFGIIPIEMRWLLALFIAIDSGPFLYQLLENGGNSGTAHSAHLGGLLFGFLYFRGNMRLSAWWDHAVRGRVHTRIRRARSNLKVFTGDEAPAADSPAEDPRVDEILEKISQHGQKSLTMRERNILKQASRKLRKGRP